MEPGAPTAAAGRLGSDGPLDCEAFAAFAPLLEACQDYAGLTGCRVLHSGDGALFGERGGGHETQSSTAESLALRAARDKAAAVVAEYGRRLETQDGALTEGVERACRLVLDEGIRSGIIATSRQLDLWPPRPPPAGVEADDCSYQDTTAPLPTIAQRAYNDEARRGEAAMAGLARRLATASFLSDFAAEAARRPATMSPSQSTMLQEFMARVEEWLASSRPGAPAEPSALPPALMRAARSAQSALELAWGGDAAAKARDALISSLDAGRAALSPAREQVAARWSRNWETPAGAAVNVALVGLTAAAAVATLRAAARRR